MSTLKDTSITGKLTLNDIGGGVIEDVFAKLSDLITYYELNGSCSCIRFGGGLNIQICYGTLTVVASLSQNGSGYTGTSSNISNGTFAKPFSVLNSVHLTPNSSDWAHVENKAADSVGITSITLGYFAQYSGRSFDFDYLAIGKY